MAIDALRRFTSPGALRVVFSSAAAVLIFCFVEAFLLGGGSDDPFAFVHVWAAAVAAASAGWYLLRTRSQPEESRGLAWAVLIGASGWLVLVAVVGTGYAFLMKDFK